MSSKSKIDPEIEAIIASITKEHGEGIINVLGKSWVANKNVLSTGSFILDQAIGGGYVFGKMVEVYGEEGSGKTTFALQAVRECQKLGKRAVYVDVENALDIKHSQNIGVDTDQLITLHPEYGEQAFKLILDILNHNQSQPKSKIGLIVIDSVAALIPKGELEGDLEKPLIGLHARMMASGLKQINHRLAGQAVIILLINQIRNKISTGFFFGSTKTTTGGIALKYFANLRLELKEREKIEKGGECIGIKVSARIKKNRSGPPYKELPLEIMFKGGVQKEREIVDLATELNILQKGGSWYSYAEKKLGQGKENVVDYLTENPVLAQELEEKIVEKIR
ncbi:MAG: AAA family ATPase [Candidatus Moeniiplasma glomeromycotorum]|nr:AAA family ATPase [Candidatus Moeniiplasma glomeromycotorum]MCE8167044.1 AAA family ATPase [Candidatus Moeniiplasma glomeromycotorum]MCE8168944.1 AAA family ATPase [Candidatus Moeniiplasma glomeromycotorum]